MRWLLYICILMLPMLSAAQSCDVVYNDADTLLYVGGQLINTEKYLLNRDNLRKKDTVLVNKPGMYVEQFTVSAFALGTKITMSNIGNILSDEVLDVLTNNELNFKFFYLKDIILRANDGRRCVPSTRTIKITFSN